MENVEEVLKKLVECNTIKDKENTKIMNYIENLLLQYGFKTEKKDKFLIMSNKNVNALGFVGHTDTVEYTTNWKYDKFTTSKINNKIYGLGVCDMKSGIAGIISAISQIDFSNLTKGIKLYFTYDEEIGFSGIKDVVKNEKEFPKTIIVGEPTNNEIMVGSKGLLEYEISFKGFKVHSSTPEKGKNAIISAVDFINELKEFYETKIKLTGTTMNIGKIEGGSAINSVAELCRILVDFRTVDIETENKIIDEVRKLEKKYCPKITVLNQIPAFKNETTYYSKISNFITEASFLKNNRIILGAGPVTSHEVNEYIEVESLYKLVQQYKELIEQYCK